MNKRFNRRDVLIGTSAAAAASLAVGSVLGRPETAIADDESDARSFQYCLNTSTIRGQELSLVEEIEITAKAGYQGIEPWVGKIRKYAESGNSLKDLKKRIDDLGLTVESAIGFANWIVDDDQRRAQGLEDARRDMDLLNQIGGKRIAAPPAGATGQTDMNLLKAAERYRALLELGDEMGVTPQVEIWGPSKTLGRLGEAVFVALESGHPKACILPDVYHIYKGGTDFNGLRLIEGSAIEVMHLNDYPADPPREAIGDADRVYPGDGVAPLKQILQTLHQTGCRAMLSLELFNREYWKQDALSVARTGLEKMREAVHKSLG